MAEDTATLRDTVVVSDEPTPTPEPAATPAEPTQEIRILDAPDPQAAEIGQILLNSGVTKDQLNDLLEAPNALASLRHAIQNNPQEFLNMLARTDPKTEERFLESMADTYVNRFGDKTAKPSKPSGDSRTDDLMREVEILRNETAQLKTEQQRRDQAIALAAAKQRYDARVDDLFGLKEVAEMGLGKSEMKNMRARLSTELSQDPTVVQRISNGNFVDVPKAFQSLLQEKVEERKAADTAAKEKLERSKRGAYPEFPAGPNPFMQELDKNSPIFDSDEAFESAFAKALASTGQR